MTSGTKGALIGGVVVLGLAGGWFLMSHLLMGTAVGDALGEALGVGLGFLIVGSVVGAVRSNRHADRAKQDQDR